LGTLNKRKERNDMKKWKYDHFDEHIPEADRKVLDEKREAIFEGVGRQSIYWKLMKAAKERNHYRALAYSCRSKTLCQFVIDDIRNLDDQSLKSKIRDGKFPERSVT
jgi:hypothetical protein